MLKIVLIAHLTYENQRGKLHTKIQTFVFWDPLVTVSDTFSAHRVSSRHGEVEVGGGQRPVARDGNDHQLSSWKVFFAFFSDQGPIIVYPYQQLKIT